jgi:hypothetical protein
LTRGNLNLQIDVERVFDFYSNNMKLLKALAALQDRPALRVQELVEIATADPTEENLVNACLAIEEFRRCLYQ